MTTRKDSSVRRDKQIENTRCKEGLRKKDREDRRKSIK